MSTEEITKVAGQVVSGLQSSPILLALISLNLIGIAAALYFLNTLTANQAKRIDMLMAVCLPGLKP